MAHLEYVELSLSIPFLKNKLFHMFVLVVSMMGSNFEVPFIIGANVIRLCHVDSLRTFKINISETWKTAFQTLVDDTVGVVKATQKIILQLYEIRTITWSVRESHSNKVIAIESASTEPCSDDLCSSRIHVCQKGW